MGINIRQKGAKGELEFINRFTPFFPQEIKRNLEQVRSGGSDIEGCYPLVIEIKRVEDQSDGNKNSWWRQVSQAVTNPEDEIPVVAFRKNRSPWKFLLPASYLIPGNHGYVEASEELFLAFVLQIYDKQDKHE